MLLERKVESGKVEANAPVTAAKDTRPERNYMDRALKGAFSKTAARASKEAASTPKIEVLGDSAKAKLCKCLPYGCLQVVLREKKEKSLLRSFWTLLRLGACLRIIRSS